MNRNVSQEDLGIVSAGLLVAGTSLLAKYAPKVIAGITEKLAATGSEKVIKKAKEAMALSTSGDLVRFTQSARVEPILLMDKRSMNTPFIQDVVHSMYNMFTGYWLLAVSLDTKINGVSVGRRLDKFATDRDLADATLNALTVSTASMESFGLPFIEEIVAEQDALQASMEAVNDNQMSAASVIADIASIEDDEKRENLRKEFERMQAHADGHAERTLDSERNALEEEFKKKLADAKLNNKMGVASASKYVEKANNLAVGNVIDVTISEDGKEAVIPVTIRLRVASMPSDTMVQTLAVGGRDATFSSRFRAWRAGEIGFWSDFVLQMDRVDAHRAAMMKDESGYYKTVYSRARQNAAAAVLANGPSLSTASALIVIDIATAQELERRIGGRLDNFKTRQGIFGHTYSMLLCVVDPDWESLTIYTRGIEMPTKLTAKDIKTAGKSDSKEMMDILKSYQLGRAPGRI